MTAATGSVRRLSAVANAVGGTLVGADAEFGAVASDTRTLPPGALFVALRGPRFDANQFVAAAADAGAAGAIVDRLAAHPLPHILVGDTLAALQTYATAWRDRFEGPVVAVAGSNGKTTTKGMTAAILARRGPTLATQGNLNNHIGVPLTLLRLQPTDRAAVIELGANRIGDVADLMALVRPSVGLITNAGAEHLEFFGDLDGVARGEGETVAHLGGDAVAVINADDPYADYWRGVSRAGRLLSFGLAASADFRAVDWQVGIAAGEFLTRFTLHCPLGELRIRLHAGGAHNLINALGSAAAASAAGATLAEIGAGLEDFRAVAGRLQLKPGSRGSSIIDDSYNANPSSVRAGLDVLGSLPGRKWLVFGDMGELGGHAASSHSEVGAYARRCGVERLFALGTLTPGTVASFGVGGEWFADAESMVRRLEAELAAGVTVLVKGSRVNRLERVVAALTRPDPSLPAD
jgi:UDP-N-acetylmuramoyl-tripeptide--D-alanyl-D-alanine ligase